MDLKDKTVVVTGAGSGIGRALALAFARSGASVACVARRPPRLDQTVGLIEDEGGTALAVPTDVTDREQVRHMVDTVLKRCKRIDVVFNNAGRFHSIAGVHEIDPADWWKDVTVNLYGPLLVIREVLPHMLERNEGILINMNGGRPVGGTGYACGKAGLMELNRVLALELEMMNSRVIVLGAGPGLVRTEMTEWQATTEAGRKWIPSTQECFASGELRRPEEIAAKTIEVVTAATPAWSGKCFGPDTDLEEWK